MDSGTELFKKKKGGLLKWCTHVTYACTHAHGFFCVCVCVCVCIYAALPTRADVCVRCICALHVLARLCVRLYMLPYAAPLRTGLSSVYYICPCLHAHARIPVCVPLGAFIEHVLPSLSQAPGIQHDQSVFM